MSTTHAPRPPRVSKTLPSSVTGEATTASLESQRGMPARRCLPDTRLRAEDRPGMLRSRGRGRGLEGRTRTGSGAVWQTSGRFLTEGRRAAGFSPRGPR